MNTKFVIIAVAAAFLCGTVGWLIFHQQSNEERIQGDLVSSDEGDPRSTIKGIISQATELVENGRFEEAEKMALIGLKQAPQSPDLLLIAARAAGEMQKIDLAITYCDQVSKAASPHFEIAAWVPCELLFRNKRFHEAEIRTRTFLGIFPDREDARKRFIYLLNLSGRNFEATPHLLYLIQHRQFGIETLLFLSDVEKIVDYSEQLNSVELQSDDPVRLLGLAKIAFANDRYAEAEQLLTKLLQIDPVSLEGIATLGEIYYQTKRFDELDRWEQKLTENLSTHPSIWLVRGLAARESGQPEWAVRYLWEAVRRAPTHRRILFALGRALEVIGKQEEAKQYLALHEELSEYVRSCERMYGRQPTIEDLTAAALFCNRTGRLWEAWGWTQVAVKTTSRPMDSGGKEMADLATSLIPQLNSAGIGQVVLDHHPATMLDINSINFPPRLRFERNSIASAETPNAEPSGQPQSAITQKNEFGGIRFVDEAANANFRFEYFDAADASTEGKRIYEFGGGGVGAIDMDRDGLVDVYLTQGCSWPPGSRTELHQNSLQRNLNGESFVEIAEEAGVNDRGFGQGVAIGDVDGDGFPDVYVANIGVNRLFLNNGDGTFRGVAEQAIEKDSKWTTSCLLADLNGDGNPDIYDVNYLQGENIYDRICVWEGARRRICGPATFQPAQDRMLIGLGGPEFRDVTDSSGIVLSGGTGLGIIAGDLQGSGNIDLFVANDQHKNFYLIRDKNSEPSAPRFEERAVISGLAFDAGGLAQACMGVAAGDVDGNGMTDLFITNFFRESNTLYVQESPGYFSDLARSSGLREPSFEMLGFGTQFLDIELDGDLDLVLTNGHLDDFTYLSQPYEMPPQVYRNAGDGKFQLVPAETLGEFFQGRYRGRGLARLDWNRDGAEDFIVSHLDRPTSLLTNRTEGRGGSITVELVGVKSSRDAVGASVSLTANGRRLTRSVFAGDGYQASNERILVFGLGNGSSASDVVVRWPSGESQPIKVPKLTRGRYLIIEGGRVMRLSSED